MLSGLYFSNFPFFLSFSRFEQVLPTIPHAQRTRVAHFLEQQGFKQQALAVSTDVDHK
jgi:coatomer subunit beta'